MRDRLRQRPGGTGRPLTGSDSTDRGTAGSKIHLITDRNGLPPSLGISGVSTPGGLGLEPLVRGCAGSGRSLPARRHPVPGAASDHREHPPEGNERRGPAVDGKPGTPGPTGR
ncbi:hypothetical protein GCM10010524_07800 [Streptomyces mexicanus]